MPRASAPFGYRSLTTWLTNHLRRSFQKVNAEVEIVHKILRLCDKVGTFIEANPLPWPPISPGIHFESHGQLQVQLL